MQRAFSSMSAHTHDLTDLGEYTSDHTISKKQASVILSRAQLFERKKWWREASDIVQHRLFLVFLHELGLNAEGY